MIMQMIAVYNHSGYIAGTSNGIVTVDEMPASRRVDLLDIQTYNLIQSCKSTLTGHYLFSQIDANKEYLVICRDFKREYEPVAYDYVKPATDLTPAEQQDLWRSWQEK